MISTKYVAYRDSGVAWLGPIPEHWTVVAIKRLASLRSGDSITAESITEAGDYPVYGGNGIRGFTAAFTHEGEFALVGRQGALCGNVNFAKGRFWASEHAVVVMPTRPLVTAWLREVLRAMNLNQYSVSAAQPGLSVEMVSNLSLPCPPLDEQQAIGAFLDCETAKIDALVEEQRRLIELLKEKRQAVISQAVTKGLSPNVLMKDSAVEWLGKVPAHWDFGALRWYAKCASGSGISAGELEGEADDRHGIPVIGGNGLMGFTHEASIEQMVLAVGRVGALCGNVHIVPPPSWITDNALVVRPCSDHFRIPYIAAVLRARGLNDIAAKTAQPLITGTQVMDQRVPRPPLDEQDAIISFVDKHATDCDRLIAESTKATLLLQERRAALISAAVTGKIDVRGLVPQPEAIAA